MLLYELVEKCNYRNGNQIMHEQCEDCAYGEDCPHNCIKCLEYVHFPQRVSNTRKYDCTHMADCYYCKYSFRYASEIVYGLRHFRDIQEKDNLKVMSVGCGPCTELAAIDYLRKLNELNYTTLEFRGIDPLKDVWKLIWRDIKEYFGQGIRFFDRDMLDMVDIIIEKKWVPDLIIFQYVFSDMYKNNEEEDIKSFIGKLANFLDQQTNKPIYILANDTNLGTLYAGGRDFFDILFKKINSPKIVKQVHFDNSNRERHFEYGDEYKSNELIFNSISKEIEELYNPFDSCASAQVLIKKK